MKALTFDPQDNHFQIRELPAPEPGPQDVLLEVEACGLNPIDAKIRAWKSTFQAAHKIWVPGLDVSGRIVSLGSAVSGWKVGQRVLCHGNMFRPHGGFAETCIQDAAIIIPHPDLPAAQAAATPCAGWTAWRAIHDKLRANAQDSILITGGSGGVGSFAIQIAQYLGLKTIIATCSAKNREYVISLGATDVIDYHAENISERVLQITGRRGVTLGLDTVGADNDIAVANALAYEGRMVELVDTLRPAEYKDAFQKGLGFQQLSLGSGHRYGKPAQQAMVEAGTAFSALVEQGLIRVTNLTTISMPEVAPALDEMLAQRTVGKIVMLA